MTIDYKKIIVYKIQCNDPKITNVYVGHSTNLKKTEMDHKRLSLKAKPFRNYEFGKKREKNRQLYDTIRLNGGWSNYSMIKIEDYPCENKVEVDMRKRYWFDVLNCSNMNSYKPRRTEIELTNEYKRENLKQKKILLNNRIMRDRHNKMCREYHNNLNFIKQDFIKLQNIHDRINILFKNINYNLKIFMDRD